MPQVAVTINGRNYQIACDEGQEEHLSRLASYVDDRVQELVAAVGQVGDTRLLVMTSLLVADDLSEAYSTLSEAGLGPPEEGTPPITIHDRDAAFAERVEAMAVRIETIAASL
jgi:cell division protein ZapA